jgi:DNA-binding Xre family transcriptional regulator
MNFQVALDKTLKDRGIKGAEIAQVCACSQGHISQLRNGGECTLAFQSRLLEALDEFGACSYLMALWRSELVDQPITARQAIATLQQQELTDAEVADLLAIASRHMRVAKTTKSFAIAV